MKKTLKFLLCSTMMMAAGHTAHAQGVLSGSVAAATNTTVNLTAEGTSDWAHWGLNGIGRDHKVLGGNQISDYTLTNGYGPNQFTDNYTPFSWSDGAPNASTGGTINGIYTGNLTGGFSFTAYADTNARTLKVYVGGYQSGGTLTAHLSDGFANDFTDASAGQSGLGNTDGNHYYAVYTLNYKAASAGQNVTVSWTQNTNGGNISLVAASLSGANPPLPAAPTLTASAGSSRVHLAWDSPTGASQFNIKRSNSANGTYTTIATTTAASYDDNGLTNGTTYYYKVSALNLTGEGPNSNPAFATPQAGIDGTGLLGEYHSGLGDPNNPNPPFDSASIITTEVDPGVNFNADGFRPLFVPHDNISVKWTGSVKAPVDGDYVFSTNADDGIRLFIDGNLVIDNYVYQGATYRSANPITFTAGSLHTVEVDYFQGGGGGLAQLYWAYPGQSSQIVPYYALYPNLPQSAPAAPVNLNAFGGSNQVALTWYTGFNAVSYRIQRSLSSTGGFSSLATIPATLYTFLNSYKDTTAQNGTTYYYRVIASNAYGDSAASNVAAAVPTASVQPVAYWRFEDGVAGQPAPTQQGMNIPATQDISGNSNSLFAFDNNTTPTFRNNVAGNILNPVAVNKLSVDFTAPSGYNPGTRDLYTNGGSQINTHVFNQFTIEASVNTAVTSGYRTFVGRDGGNIPNSDGVLAGVYFQIPDPSATGGTQVIVFRTHRADGVFVGVDGVTPILPNKWYNAAAVSDGQTLSLYLQTTPGGPYHLEGSTAFGGQMYKQDNYSWTVGRGWYSGGPADQCFSLVDEVRISDVALDPSQFLFAAPSGTTVTGKIALEGVTNLAGVPANVALGTFHVEFRTPGTTTVVKSADVTLSPGRHYRVRHIQRFRRGGRQLRHRHQRKQAAARGGAERGGQWFFLRPCQCHASFRRRHE